MAQRKTAEEIGQLLSAYRDRGEMTREEFCKHRGIPVKSLGYYWRRYRNDAAEPVKLARVELRDTEGAGRYTLVLDNGRRIECGEAGLAQLIRMAEVA